MRNFSLFLLLATSAMPAMAQRGNDDDHQSRRASQSDQSESPPQHAERPQRAERSQARDQRHIQVERPVQAEGRRSERMQRYQQQVQQQQEQHGDASRSERIQRYQQRVQEQQEQHADGQPSRSERIEQFRRRQLEAGQHVGRGGLAPRERRIRTIPTTAPEAGQAGPVRHDVLTGRRVNRDDRNRWTNRWRDDRRYDWRRYRDRNRSVFRIGFYYDPFGYSYRRFGIGSFLYSNYYQSNYWLSDPWQYRLPPAYGPYRWIRYHNDAVMIDTWTGEVVDVIYGFFW